MGGRGRQWKGLQGEVSGVGQRDGCGGDLIGMICRSLGDLGGLRREGGWSVWRGEGRVG